METHSEDLGSSQYLHSLTAVKSISTAPSYPHKRQHWEPVQGEHESGMEDVEDIGRMLSQTQSQGGCGQASNGQVDSNDWSVGGMAFGRLSIPLH